MPEQEPRKLATSQHIQAWARRIAQLIALVLQRLILGLEQLIELLGCEPDRRWENALVLHACGAGKGDVKSICKRAKMLAEKGYTEDALSLYVKVRKLPWFGQFKQLLPANQPMFRLPHAELMDVAACQVLEIEPDNTVVMDMAAELLAELGDAEGAKELLARSIELQPSMGYEKFVLLGHLENGMTAVCAFERGLELLKNEAAQLKGRTSPPLPLSRATGLDPCMDQTSMFYITLSNDGMLLQVPLTDRAQGKRQPQDCPRFRRKCR